MPKRSRIYGIIAGPACFRKDDTRCFVTPNGTAILDWGSTNDHAFDVQHVSSLLSRGVSISAHVLKWRRRNQHRPDLLVLNLELSLRMHCC